MFASNYYPYSYSLTCLCLLTASASLSSLVTFGLAPAHLSSTSAESLLLLRQLFRFHLNRINRLHLLHLTILHSYIDRSPPSNNNNPRRARATATDGSPRFASLAAQHAPASLRVLSTCTPSRHVPSITASSSFPRPHRRGAFLTRSRPARRSQLATTTFDPIGCTQRNILPSSCSYTYHYRTQRLPSRAHSNRRRDPRDQARRSQGQRRSTQGYNHQKVGC